MNYQKQASVPPSPKDLAAMKRRSHQRSNSGIDMNALKSAQESIAASSGHPQGALPSFEEAMQDRQSRAGRPGKEELPSFDQAMQARNSRVARGQTTDAAGHASEGLPTYNEAIAKLSSGESADSYLQSLGRSHTAEKAHENAKAAAAFQPETAPKVKEEIPSREVNSILRKKPDEKLEKGSIRFSDDQRSVQRFKKDSPPDDPMNKKRNAKFP